MKPDTKLIQITSHLIRAGIHEKVSLKLDNPEAPTLLYCTTQHHAYTLLFSASAVSIGASLADIMRREQARHRAGTCPYCTTTETKETQ